MARTKAFDPDVAIQKAMQSFWANGYEGTTIGELENVTGLARTSLYNAFGDKDAIFDAALAQYHQAAKETMGQFLGGRGISALEMLFEGLASPQDITAPENFGCLMVNTVLDVRNVSGAASLRVKAYRTMVLEAFEQVIERDKSAGLLEPHVKAAESAEFLVAAMWGILATVRLYGDPEAAVIIVKQVTGIIQSWRA